MTATSSSSVERLLKRNRVAVRLVRLASTGFYSETEVKLKKRVDLPGRPRKKSAV